MGRKVWDACIFIVTESNRTTHCNSLWISMQSCTFDSRSWFWNGPKLQLCEWAVLKMPTVVSDGVLIAKPERSSARLAPWPISPQSTKGYLPYSEHKIVTIPQKEDGKKKYPQKSCRYCWRAGRRRDTRFMCEQCCVPLCKFICFEQHQLTSNLDVSINNWFYMLFASFLERNGVFFLYCRVTISVSFEEYSIWILKKIFFIILAMCYLLILQPFVCTF